MDIKEFTKKYEGDSLVISHGALLEDIRQLEESYVVEIEQFVADWIKYCKKTGVTLKQALEVGEVVFYNYANQKDFKKLHEFMEDEDNQEIFSQAWLDGYTVMEEERYLVQLRGVIDGTKALKHDTSNDDWYMGIVHEVNYIKVFHTKRELEAGGFSGVFDNPLFEVKEIE
mgnify:CR=1 FL=1|jgi:hypothetical protein